MRGRKFIAKSANGYVFGCFALTFGTAFFTTFGLLVVFASTFGAGLAVTLDFGFETAFVGVFCGVAFSTGFVAFAFVAGLTVAFGFAPGFGVDLDFETGFVGALALVALVGCLVFYFVVGFAVVVFAFTFVVAFAFVSVFF